MSQEEFIEAGMTNPVFLDALLAKLKAQSVKDHRFDFNYSLADGKTGERLVDSILTGGKKVEVKLDNRVSETGNLLVEYAHGSKPSGITTTEADYYAFVLGGEEFNKELIIFVTTDRLRKLIANCSKANPRPGVKGNSEFVLLPLDKLLEKGCTETPFG
jgi:hypothetical protein